MNTCHWPASLSQEQRRRVVDCARWSKMAYANPSEMASTVQPDCVRNIAYISCDEGDAQSIIFDHSDGSLVIAVRGTNSIEDMLCDIRVVQTLLEDIPDALVHSGFNQQFKALSKAMNARIMKHLVGGGNLVCTGHSLGAGVAALFAVSYGIRFPDKVSYFGFGSPRQGNTVFGQLMMSQTSLAVTVKNLRDPVCDSVPALCLPSKYAHAGLRLSIGKDPTPGIDILHIADHDISGYIANLEAGVCPTDRTTVR